MANGFRVIQWFKDAIEKRVELRASRNVDVRDVKTVCLALGPYRNLTTLTASVLFLHPNCQVLNHAGGRILGDRRLDFLKHWERTTFDTFKRYAIYTSAKGRRGEYGGSITHSHAFDADHKMRDLFDEGSGGLVKRRIDCLFWKESLRTANHIRANKVDFEGLFAGNEEIRFMLPVRNPLDCAVSNLKTGLVTTFAGLSANSSVERVVSAILDEFLWVAELKQKSSDRVFIYSEHDVSRRLFGEMAEFLKLPADAGWVDRAMDAFELKKGYEHAPRLIEFYQRQVERRFAGYPEMQRRLLKFYDGRSASAAGLVA